MFKNCKNRFLEKPAILLDDKNIDFAKKKLRL